jgi:LuxR family maltose regulon positive regulatory protein
MLLEGNMETAGAWVDSLIDPPPNMALLWLEEPEITRVRILIARGGSIDLKSAQEIVNLLEDIVDRTHNTRHKIEILALRALLSSSRGNIVEAESNLKQALELSRVGGFIRVFLDFGKPMRDLLVKLQKQNIAEGYLKKILDSFESEDKRAFHEKSLVKELITMNEKVQLLIEPLTPRELEVVNYLSGPLSIKEIAGKLNISYATAKRHTINLYSKLGVNQRRDAVTRALELGILLPD